MVWKKTFNGNPVRKNCILWCFLLIGCGVYRYYHVRLDLTITTLEIYKSIFP